MKKELFIKYLNNQCTEAEISEVLDWFRTASLGESGRQWGIDLWNSWQESDNLQDEESLASIFDKIQDRISIKENKSKTFRLLDFSNWVTKVAAVLLLPVLGILFYTLIERRVEPVGYASGNVDSVEVIAPPGCRTVVQLSDGSEVWLNYGSKLKYPHLFTGNTREVRLSGEGFFKVAHNPDKPFIVNAHSLNIKAVGTSFNVMAYPDHDFVTTTLVTGKVILEQVGDDGKRSRLGSMSPGLHVRYNLSTKALTSKEGHIEVYTSWTEGKLLFEDTPLLEVTDRLSRRFNVDFTVDDALKDYNYTVTFTEEEQLSQILELMSIATPIRYKILPRSQLPDGSYSRQKIVLEKRI